MVTVSVHYDDPDHDIVVCNVYNDSIKRDKNLFIFTCNRDDGSNMQVLINLDYAVRIEIED